MPHFDSKTNNDLIAKSLGALKASYSKVRQMRKSKNLDTNESLIRNEAEFSSYLLIRKLTY